MRDEAGRYKAGVPRPDRQTFSDAQLMRLYCTRRLSIKKCAEVLGVAESSVRRRLLRLDITPRKGSRFDKYHTNRVTHGKYLFARKYKDSHPVCEYCGWGVGGTDLHHIVPVSQGGEDEEDNVVSLCPNHHRLADRGILKIWKKDGVTTVLDWSVGRLVGI